MELFTPVAIVCDRTLDDVADAIRRVLESFRLRVDFFRLVQRPQLLDFFSGERHYPYTILCTHGGGKSDEDSHIAVEVVEQRDGDYKAADNWTSITIRMDPEFVTQNIRDRSGTLLSLACGSGYPLQAEAFLTAGYRSYIAPLLPYYDTQAGVTFVTNFFYFLLAEDRDYAEQVFSEQEAAALASSIDEKFEFGPRVFRRYEQSL